MNRGLAPNDDDTNDNQVDQHVHTTSLFVTKRRGKASKRKNSEDVNTESEALEVMSYCTIISNSSNTILKHGEFWSVK